MPFMTVTKTKFRVFIHQNLFINGKQGNIENE
jgi:hypothetical protein